MGGFATNGVNMTKLESYQLDGRFVATMFYADIEGHPDDPRGGARAGGAVVLFQRAEDPRCLSRQPLPRRGDQAERRCVARRRDAIYQAPTYRWSILGPVDRYSVTSKGHFLPGRAPCATTSSCDPPCERHPCKGTNGSWAPCIRSFSPAARARACGRCRGPCTQSSSCASSGQASSFLSSTLQRLPASAGFAAPIIIGNSDHRFLIEEEAARAGLSPRPSSSSRWPATRHPPLRLPRSSSPARTPAASLSSCRPTTPSRTSRGSSRP